MHETSLIKAILAQVNQIRHQQGAREVLGIRVSFGPLSGIEPELIRSAFEQIKSGTNCEHAELELMRVALRGMCEHCGVESEFEELDFRCPVCLHRKMRFHTGQEVRLESVALLLPDTTEIGK